MTLSADDMTWQLMSDADRAELTHLNALDITCSCHPGECPVDVAVLFDDEPPLVLCYSCYRQQWLEFARNRVWPLHQ